MTTLSDINRVTESELRVDLDSVWDAPPVKRLDGKELDQSTPRYLLTSRPLSDYMNVGAKFAIKITDLGGGKILMSTMAYIQMGLPSII